MNQPRPPQDPSPDSLGSGLPRTAPAPDSPPPHRSPPPLPRRDPRGHKGTFGTVAVLGGSAFGAGRMIGAPALSALAALRAGAGLVRLVMPEPILAHGMALAPSATGIALPVDPSGGIVPHEAARTVDELVAASTCLVIGPGMGAAPGVAAATLRAVQQEDIPIVVDADALNALASTPHLFRDFHARAVLTPHPGEFARLAAVLKIPHSPTDPAARPAAAATLAQRLGCVVVLKGPGTVVSDGLQTYTCPRGHPCLGTAGTGDVLAGLVAALIAQFAPPTAAAQLARPIPGTLSLFDAACIAVLAHALAGEAWAGSHAAAAGLLATELADALPAALESLRTS